MDAAYRVETARLVLRPWAPEDAPVLRESLDASDAHLRPFIPFMASEPRTLGGTMQWLRTLRASFDRDEAHRYAVFLAGTGELVGETMLLYRAGPGAAEIGYWTDVRHTGKGYCTEAAAAMVRAGFAVHGLERIEIVHESPANDASGRVAERLGFSREATLRRRIERDGERYDTALWTLHKADYAASPAALAEVAPRFFDGLGNACVEQGA